MTVGIRIVTVLVIGFFLASCSGSVSQDHAEWIAQDFVNKNVKFFATDEEEKKDLQSYTLESIDSYSEGKFWIVVFHVESQLNNETKKGDLVVKVDFEGNVVEFNGRPIR